MDQILHGISLFDVIYYYYYSQHTQVSFEKYKSSLVV
jgi:hypothetical protein